MILAKKAKKQWSKVLIFEWDVNEIGLPLPTGYCIEAYWVT